MQPSHTEDLQRLVNNLLRPGHRQYETHLRLLHTFVLEKPVLRGVVDALVACTQDFDVEAWYRREVDRPQRSYANWPESDKHKVRGCWKLIESCVTPDEDGQIAFAGAVARRFSLAGSNDLDEQVYLFTRIVVAPLVEYVEARLYAASNILYLLERYRRKCEWFERGSLYKRYSDDTQRGEAIYDGDLRRFLFDQGLDYPFSKPQSASGEADVIAEIHTDDPLVCEVKLFDAGSYGVPYVAKGVRQAIRYAHDYGARVAHLVVFNLSETRLELPTDDEPSGRPPRLVVEGVTVFLCVVQAHPLPPASADRRAQVRRVTRNELVREAEPDEPS